MGLKTPPSLIEKADETLGKNLIFLIPACFVIGYLTKSFMPQLKWSATYVLFTIMFASTYGLRWADFFSLGERKNLIITGIMGQIFLLPLIAHIISITFYSPDSPWRVGHLCVAASPAAISTIIWSRISKGDVALGVVLVGLHVILVPFLAPVILKIFVGKSAHVPLFALFIKLFLSVFVPTIAAVVLYERHKTETPKPFFSAWAKLGMLYMIVLNTSVAFSAVPLSLHMLKLLGIMAIQVSCFYLTGICVGRLLKTPEKAQITFSYFMGMKNNGAALVMALSGFPLKATLPVALAIMCQQPLASFIDRYWRSKK
ncbi:MAG: hypothetical protein GXO44_01555 [Deferribacteres bacterium]|nr:hypothetical protein [Deferribacteres bacterium]